MGLDPVPGTTHNPVSNVSPPAQWGDDVNTAFQDIEDSIGFAINNPDLSSWTPTISQGASSNVSKTIQYARFLKLGRLVLFQFRLDVTGTGTAGADIQVSLPFTRSAGYGANQSVGIFDFVDASAGQFYHGSCHLNASLARGFRDNVGSLAMGVNPNVALASGDVLIGSGWYEANS